MYIKFYRNQLAFVEDITKNILVCMLSVHSVIANGVCLYHVARWRHWPSKVILSCEVAKIGSFRAPKFFWASTPKNFFSVLLPTNTHHVLKFRKDPF